MQGKTHLVVGTAVTLAVMHPDNVPELLCGAGLAAVGSLISDADVGTSESSQKGAIATGIGFLLTLILVLIEAKWDIGIARYLLSKSNVLRMVLGIIIVLIICLFGKAHPHRTFMHSLLALMLLSGGMFVMFPVAVPYFAVGFLSHIVLDLFNKKGVQMFYPAKPKICLGMCSADGGANKFLFAVGNLSLIIIVAVLVIRIVVNYVAK